MKQSKANYVEVEIEVIRFSEEVVRTSGDMFDAGEEDFFDGTYKPSWLKD